MSTMATWEFEAADPEVGFLTDSITHTCEANLDEAQPATVNSTTFVAQPCGKLVNEITTFGCPVCAATTTLTEQWPAWMFEEPRDEEEGR